MKKIILTFIVSIIAVGMVAQAKFTVASPGNQIEGSKFRVSYTLENADGSSFNAPQIEGLSLLMGPSTSTQRSVNIINGKTTMSYTTTYTFVYRADAEGTYTIPAASIIADGKKLTTKPVTFKVLPPDQSAASTAGSGQSQQVHVYDDQSQNASKDISKNDIFVRVILNKSHAYEGEAIECIIKLYTKYQQITSISGVKAPAYDGFMKEVLKDQPTLSSDLEHYNGENYLTAVLEKSILFPQKAGDLTITTGEYDLQVQQTEIVSNGYWRMARPVVKTVRLQPFKQKVTISPLPQPQPASFTGAVGKYNFESQLSSETPRTGEAISLKYIITGTGNVKYLKEPQPIIPDEFEQYTPKVDVNARISGSTMTGTMTVDYTLVPQSVGKFKIPEQEFTYFDPATKDYVTLTAPGYNVEVSKGSGTTSYTDQTNIEVKNTDILHIKPGPKHLSTTHTPIIYKAWYWIVFALLIVATATCVVLYHRRLKQNADVVGRRTSQANKVARKRLKAAADFMKAHQPDRFYDAMLKAMWGYLSDKLNMPASQLTRQNIVDTLTSRGVSEDLSQSVISILDQCEMARYTPDSSLDTSVEALYNEATQTINAMEKAKISRKA